MYFFFYKEVSVITYKLKEGQHNLPNKIKTKILVFVQAVHEKHL